MVTEDMGESDIANRYGVKSYPAVFVNEALIAQPKDFYFYKAGGGEDTGKYTPWEEPGRHAKFQEELRQMIEIALKGDRLPEGVTVADDQLTKMPEFSVKNFEGETVTSSDLKGKIAIVEFWATWCPPCRVTMQRLGALTQQYGDDVQVVAIAVESREEDVRKFVKELDHPVPTVLGTDDLVVAFGNLGVVPTLYIFDRNGKTAAVFYGAPDDLHDKINESVAVLR